MKIRIGLISALCIIASTSNARDNQTEIASKTAEHAVAWGVPRPLIAGSWEELDRWQSLSFQAQLRTALAKEHHGAIRAITRFRKMALPFYPNAFLYEGETKLAWGVPAVITFVRGVDAETGAEQLTVMNGTSQVIHDMNSKLHLQLDTAEQAGLYLRFFCAAIQAELGTFRIVEDRDDLRLKQDVSSGTLAKLSRNISPIRVKRTEQAWSAVAVMAYSDVLLASTFRITDTGSVEMLEDHSLAKELPIGRAIFDGPIRVDPEARAIISEQRKREFKPILGLRTLGDPNAPITLHEYGSISCKHCNRIHLGRFHCEREAKNKGKTIAEWDAMQTCGAFAVIKGKYIDTGRIRYVYHDAIYDPMSHKAAKISRCIDSKNAWQYLWALHYRSYFSSGDYLEGLRDLAAEFFITESVLDLCMSSDELNAALVKDSKRAANAGIRSWPTFVIGQSKLIPRSVSAIEAFIEKESN